MTRLFFRPTRRFAAVLLPALWLGLGALLPGTARAEPVDFNLPAQPAADALLAFSKQAGAEVLFSFDQLRQVQSGPVTGRLDPVAAISRLLHDTGFTAQRNDKGKFVVTPVQPPTGAIKGRLLTPDGRGAPGVRVALSPGRQSARTDAQGEYRFPKLLAGSYQLTAVGEGYQPLQLESLQVTANRELTLAPQTIHKAEDVTRLDPYIVTGETVAQPFDRSRTPFMQPTATGNRDLPRTENDALPFTIYDRDQIVRSGAVDLNGFLQRAVLESSAGMTPPEQDGGKDSFTAGSTNLNLRGYTLDETVVLVNGRRLPEVVMTDFTRGTRSVGPDVNFIPLSLVRQIEVLPVSSSALYSGTAFGGVINIVLRTGEKMDATEVTANYTNALGGFDAPQSSLSLLHSQTLLKGKLQLLLSASFTRSEPPTEAELGYFRVHDQPPGSLEDPIYRATPNIRSAGQTPLFGPGTSPVTSVAPGADGSGGLAAFAGRQGMRNLDFFKSPGGLAASSNSLDYPYGRQQRRTAYYGSAVYDIFPWLQIGLDATHVSTVVNRGFDVFSADLTLAATAPLNPFGQDVTVSLNDIAPRLGRNYSEAHLDFSSAVGGLLLKLPADWRVSVDGQYARNVARYRGIAGVDGERWQQLADQGLYNPLRDTQTHGPPPEFYDRALIYYGAPGRFVTLGDYDTLDAAVRVTKQSLALPTGTGAVNFGGDYRKVHLAGYADSRHYADGSPVANRVDWTGRTLQRYSVFGELQAPLLPARWLPPWLHKIESDLAVRYVAADTSRETNIAPTWGLKIDLAGGLSFRSSLATSNRVPTPYLSRPIISGPGGPGGINLVRITDPVRQETYDVQSNEAPNPELRPEAAISQTAGLIFQRGKVHQFRAALDFVDTRKTDEVGTLNETALLNLEAQFPERVTRAPLAPGDTHTAGRVISLLTGAVNLASRHSQNWNASLDYNWKECAGGTLAFYGRLVYFQRWDLKLFPFSPEVDELGSPDGAASSLLKYRANFGAGWSNPRYGFGLDGHYYHSRALPAGEWAGQGARQINPYWQFDAYLQSDLARWLPWKSSRYGLRGQLRLNNIFKADFPKYSSETTGAGVQPYGDWRGRTYSLSLTATF